MTSRERSIKLSDLQAISAAFAKREHELVQATTAATRELEALSSRLLSNEERLGAIDADAARTARSLSLVEQGLAALGEAQAVLARDSSDSSSCLDELKKEVGLVRDELRRVALDPRFESVSEELDRLGQGVERLSERFAGTDARIEETAAAAVQAARSADGLDREFREHRSAVDALRIPDRLSEIRSDCLDRALRLTRQVEESERALRSSMETLVGRTSELEAELRRALERIDESAARDRGRLDQLRQEWRSELDEVASRVRKSAEEAAEGRLSIARQVSEVESRLLAREVAAKASLQENVRSALDAFQDSSLRQRAWLRLQLDPVLGRLDELDRDVADAATHRIAELSEFRDEHRRQVGELRQVLEEQASRTAEVGETLDRLRHAQAEAFASCNANDERGTELQKALVGHDGRIAVLDDAIRSIEERLASLSAREAAVPALWQAIEERLKREQAASFDERIEGVLRGIDEIRSALAHTAEAVRSDADTRVNALRCELSQVADAVARLEQTVESRHRLERTLHDSVSRRLDGEMLRLHGEREESEARFSALARRVDASTEADEGIRAAIEAGARSARSDLEHSMISLRNELRGQIEGLSARLWAAEQRADAIHSRTESLEAEHDATKRGWLWRIARPLAPARVAGPLQPSTTSPDPASHPPSAPFFPARAKEEIPARVAPPAPADAVTPPGAAAASPQTTSLCISRHETMTTNPNTNRVVARNLGELLAMHDERFVHSAYLNILGRQPDPEGFASYLGLVREGAEKMQIVASLACSDEGKAVGSALPGLAEGVERWVRSGGIVKRLRRHLAAPVDPSIDARLRAIENRLAVIAEGRSSADEAIAESVTQNVVGAVQHAIQELSRSTPVSVALAMKPVLETLERLSVECKGLSERVADLERRSFAPSPNDRVAEASTAACACNAGDMFGAARPTSATPGIAIPGLLDSNTLMERVRTELRSTRGD